MNMQIVGMPKDEQERKQALRAWMVLNGMTLESVAEALKCSHQHISRVVNGFRRGNKMKTYMLDLGCPECFFPEEIKVDRR